MLNERRLVTKEPSRQGGDDVMFAGRLAIPANRIPLAMAPIDHLFAEHVRIRIACDLLDTLARRPADAGRQLPAVLAPFFREDFVRHCDDEENDLLPLLEWRLAADGAIDESLNRLRAEHATDRKALQLIVPLLDDLAVGEEIADLAKCGIVIKSFVESVRCHLDWEDATVAALADSRLTKSDCEALVAGMMRRRDGSNGSNGSNGSKG